VVPVANQAMVAGWGTFSARCWVALAAAVHRLVVHSWTPSNGRFAPVDG
jgi:hypothetical protein